jgi:anti-sigma regulatory factor (Ser/Thr protein kinase)
VALELLREPHKVKQMRLISVAHLRLWRLPAGLAHAAELVISELLGNAIQHSQSDAIGFSLAYGEGACVRIEVNDRTPCDRPEARRPGPDEESGRGLWIVAAIAEEFGGSWGRNDDRTTTWCTLSPPPTGGEQ